MIHGTYMSRTCVTDTFAGKRHQFHGSSQIVYPRNNKLVVVEVSFVFVLRSDSDTVSASLHDSPQSKLQKGCLSTDVWQFSDASIAPRIPMIPNLYGTEQQRGLSTAYHMYGNAQHILMY